MKRCLAIVVAVLMLGPGLVLGLDGTQWKLYNEDWRTLYVVGASDTLAIVGALLENDLRAGGNVTLQSLLQLNKCMEPRNMRYGQVLAIVEKYMRDHPENWDLPMSSNTWAALKESCEK